MFIIIIMREFFFSYSNAWFYRRKKEKSIVSFPTYLHHLFVYWIEVTRVQTNLGLLEGRVSIKLKRQNLLGFKFWTVWSYCLFDLVLSVWRACVGGCWGVSEWNEMGGFFEEVRPRKAFDEVWSWASSSPTVYLLVIICLLHLFFFSRVSQIKIKLSSYITSLLFPNL